MKTERPKPIVGQTLYSLNIGNAARRSKQKLTPTVVKSVGRKYFVCGKSDNEWADTKFHLEDWTEATNFSPDQRLYASPGEREEEIESNHICEKLGKAFEYGRNFRDVPLQALRQIWQLVEPP